MHLSLNPPNRRAVRLPKGFDLMTILIQHPFEPSDHKLDKHWDYHYSVFLYLLELLYPKDIKNPDAFRNLHSTYLQDIITNYRPYLEYLKAIDIIECDNIIIRGTKSLGYRYTESYRKRFTDPRFEWLKDKKILGKLKHYYQKDKLIPTMDKYSHLYESFNKLSVDWDKAYEILNDVYNSTTSFKAGLQIENLRKINDPDKWTFNCCNTGRLFNPISNLLSELRDCLICDGKRLVELDIKSSIPVISLTLFNTELYYKHFRVKLLNFIPINDCKLLDDYHNSTPYMLRENGQKQISIDQNIDKYKDIEQWKEDIFSGDIYEKVRKVWNEKLNKSLCRKEAKTELLKILNSPSYCNSTKKTILKELYPNVIEIIDQINGFFEVKNSSKKKGYSRKKNPPFAYYTQSLESYYLLDRVCGRIAKEKPDMALYTLHDAVFMLEEDKEYVRDVMIEEGVELFGLELEVK